ncbi:C1q-like domain-containing protein, partial [Lutibacter sp.]
TVDLVGLQDGDTQNTLDQAYDEGGAGAGRTITADNGAVSIEGTDGFQVTGTQGSGAALTLSGAGTRMFFNPNKAAFRAGYVNGTQWDDVNVGDYSIAMGRDTRAAGHSVALGREAVASGAQSVAMGRAVTASANNSVAIGSNITAPSYNEIVVGRFNTTYAQNSTTAWNTADRLFVVGNGANSGSRSNALTVYKDGKLNINDAYDMPLTDGTANQIMATNGTGQVSFVDPPVAGTDDQNLTGATLTGTSLQIDIENGNSTTVDLSSLTTNANALVRVTLTNTQTLTGNANTKIGFDSETYDLNSNYDITTKRFTATKSGYYKVNCTITTSSNNPAFEIMIYVNNNLRNIYYPNIPATGNFQSLSIHDVISLNANDYIEIYAYPGITSTGVESATSGGIILSYLIIEQIR